LAKKYINQYLEADYKDNGITDNEIKDFKDNVLNKVVRTKRKELYENEKSKILKIDNVNLDTDAAKLIKLYKTRTDILKLTYDLFVYYGGTFGRSFKEMFNPDSQYPSKYMIEYVTTDKKPLDSKNQLKKRPKK